MDAETEFAEEYTRQERVRFVVIGCVVGAVVVGACKVWLFPWLRGFSGAANCASVLGVNGNTVLLYGLFVGIPLFSAVLIGGLIGRRGVKILRQGRMPPAGDKVFRPTRIVRGVRAKVLGLVHVFAAVPLLALAAWGYFQAGNLERQGSPFRAGHCAATFATERAA